MPFKKRLHPCRKRNYSVFGYFSIRPTFAVNHESVVLPINIVFGKLGKFHNPKAGIEKRPDH